MLFSLLQADTALALSQSAEVTPVPQEMSISIIDMAIKGRLAYDSTPSLKYYRHLYFR